MGNKLHKGDTFVAAQKNSVRYLDKIDIYGNK